MSQDTNLPIVNPADSFDQKVQDYFVNYYNDGIQLTDNEYSAAKSFFMSRTNQNEEAAAALTAATVEAANNLGLYILDVLDQFESSDDLKSAIPTFLNLSRRGSSLLGYDVELIPSPNVLRQTGI